MLFWLHVVATGLFIGSTAGLALFVVPRSRRSADPTSRLASLVRALRFYDPLAIGLLGVMVMTGAWSVTGYKESLGEAYFRAFGAHLATKLSLAFLVVMLGTYLTLGLGHRLVRQHEWGDPMDERKLAGVQRRLVAAAWLTVLFTIATIAAAVRR